MTRSYLHLHLGLDAEGGRSGEESEAAETETTGVWLPREMKVYNLRKSGYRDNPCFLFSLVLQVFFLQRCRTQRA